MFKKTTLKSDAAFLSLLEDPEFLDKRLLILDKQRRQYALGAYDTGGCFFAMQFVFLIAAWQFRTERPTPSFILTFVFLPLMFGIKATLAHCEIRTLLMFKKLRELQKVNPA